MENKELNTEQIILEAAEAEFLEKGFGNTKMMAIAKRANVAHSMLHYYFRNKESLFQTIFLKKIQATSLLFENIVEKEIPFPEMVRGIVEAQFNFIAQNPQLPRFILNEILSNKENQALLFEIVSPKVTNILNKLEKILTYEVAKGNVRPISVYDFGMNVFSLNVFTFLALPVLQDVLVIEDKDYLKKMLDERRESNVQFILAALKP